MKTSITLIFNILFSSIAIAQTQKLTFAFDAAGNQTTRTWVCVNCPTSVELVLPDSTSGQNDSIGNAMNSSLPFRFTVDVASETIVLVEHTLWG
ncbi:hypothetical protein ACFOET_17955 [Parapedobacter deserti]|uniref:Uncharacterized protein n=1 Tax=Parapedobacter deserti TaxID=1912957 RepID=A0ABV7JQW2_9SPHI